MLKSLFDILCSRHLIIGPFTGITQKRLISIFGHFNNNDKNDDVLFWVSVIMLYKNNANHDTNILDPYSNKSNNCTQAKLRRRYYCYSRTYPMQTQRNIRRSAGATVPLCSNSGPLAWAVDEDKDVINVYVRLLLSTEKSDCKRFFYSLNVCCSCIGALKAILQLP